MSIIVLIPPSTRRCRSRKHTNPKLFYELEIAHTLEKSAIMITQRIEDILFDVCAKRAIVYENTPRGMHKLETDLKRAILSVLSEEDAVSGGN